MQQLVKIEKLQMQGWLHISKLTFFVPEKSKLCHILVPHFLIHTFTI